MTTGSQELVQVWRGDFCEGHHHGHAVVWHHGTGPVAVWGKGETVILPRSSAKMIQALPLVESGAADARGLSTEHLALSCASHRGAPMHTERVGRWLSDLGLSEASLRCGAHMPYDTATQEGMIRTETAPDQRHNNCSGKHTGFLTVCTHLGHGPEYLEIDHPLQRSILQGFEEVTDETSPGYGVDGCSAPNFACTLNGMARAMARYAAAGKGSGARDTAMVRLRSAMMEHPQLVSGEGRPTTELMRATAGRAAIKSGAEGFYIAIVPELEIGVAVKIEDGAGRASEATIAQILIGLGVLDAAHPTAQALVHAPIANVRGTITGHVVPSQTLRDFRH